MDKHSGARNRNHRSRRIPQCQYIVHDVKTRISKTPAAVRHLGFVVLVFEHLVVFNSKQKLVRIDNHASFNISRVRLEKRLFTPLNE